MSINSLLEDSQTIFGGKLKPASWVGHLDIQKDVSSKSRTVHAVFNGNSGSDWLFCAAFCVSTLVWFHIRSWDEVSFLLVMQCSAAYCKTCQLHLQEFTTWSQYTRCVQCSTAILDRLNLLCAAFYLSTLLWFLTRPSVGHAANCSILENFSAPSSRVLSMWHYLVPICTVLLLSMQQVKAIHAVLNSTQWVDSSDFSMQLFTQPAQSCA